MYYELRDMPLSSPHRYIRFVLGEQRRDDLDRVYFINHQMNDIIGRWSVVGRPIIIHRRRRIGSPPLPLRMNGYCI